MGTDLFTADDVLECPYWLTARDWWGKHQSWKLPRLPTPAHLLTRRLQMFVSGPQQGMNALLGYKPCYSMAATLA
jgi:hypothetical protein